MTHADHRALASRVETEEPSDALNEAVARAMGWTGTEDKHGWLWRSPDKRQLIHHLPRFLTDLTAAAGLMPEGWWVTLEIEPGEVCAVHVCAGHDDGLVNGDAPTEPRARVAAALRARAAGMEAQNAP